MENGSASASVPEKVIENAFKMFFFNYTCQEGNHCTVKVTMLGRMEHDFKEEKPKRNAMVWGLGEWSAQVRK